MYQEVGQDVFDLLIHLFGTRRISRVAAPACVKLYPDDLGLPRCPLIYIARKSHRTIEDHIAAINRKNGYIATSLVVSRHACCRGVKLTVQQQKIYTTRSSPNSHTVLRSNLPHCFGLCYSGRVRQHSAQSG